MEQEQGKQKSKDDKTRAIRRHYREFGGTENNKKLAQSINISADIEYNQCRFFGWGGLYMFDRMQAKLTGRALTSNTQKILDASELLAAPQPK
jgi:hypothetical protein